MVLGPEVDEEGWMIQEIDEGSGRSREGREDRKGQIG
jgi:hypothetical protein